MSEFFVVMNSNAAPFVSDKSEQFVEAENAEVALNLAIQEYSHPCGLYSAWVYSDANAKAKGHDPLVKWNSEKAAKDWKL